jgi:hypothetical protein
MKNDQAANLVRELVDQLSLNAEEALALEQAAEKIYELGHADGKANYTRSPLPADVEQPQRPIEAVQPKSAESNQNPELPRV